MASLNSRHLDMNTGDRLVVDQDYNDLTIDGYSYKLQNLTYVPGGDLSKALNMEVTPNSYIIFNYKKLSDYVVELNKFGVKNNGTSPVETAIGINNALQFAKEKGFTKVILPKGEYCISENISIIMLDNMTLDLNGSTLKINPNGKQGTTMINFTACKNARLINGTLLGDRYEHDYTTIKGSHEWNCGVVFNDCENCEMDNITVRSFTGYGVSSSLGKNISNLITGVTKSNLEIGGITEEGILNSTGGTIRTIQPMDISGTGTELELGYNKGYMGYPYIYAKTYDAYFYNRDMNFISSFKMCRQYKKVPIPQGAVYVHFVFHQATVPTKGDTDFYNTTVFLTNYRSPYRIKITNCLIEDNRCLGMGLCGGRDFLIENNILKNNKGGAPGYAIDMEDGWEYMDGYIFRGNTFVENGGDVVVPAGDNIIFDNNHFTSTVNMYGRATNYRFNNNKFESTGLGVYYEYSTNTVCSGNIYINTKVNIVKKDLDAKIAIDNERFINTSINSLPPGEEITNSSIITDASMSVRLAGVYRGCTINCQKGDYISAQLYDCIVQGTNLNCQGEVSFQSCHFINTISSTTSNTKAIVARKCKFTDSKILVATWAAVSVVDVQNGEISMLSGNNSFIDISAGKMQSLIFKNNKVNNQITKPVFNIYDSTYSLPNGKAVIEGNSFTLSKYAYVFDGVNIGSGVFIFTAKDNLVVGAELLSSKYISNQFFIIYN
ncbi:right-handed parallel beta-helix repeat-containing protein [Clostridium thermarum]|uniref:right-handed parallel beta-helix repeat-containing protein n=1 Tax=Clostridium thermarum TaxID=1716543 RepID=UPI001122B3BE|nr:right-handed parallel beta-helix repeat-containing protein [Clostridium thermarum]